MRTEIIAVASGKGGTGKTVVTACLGYALTRAGHRALMVDTDLATNGLSLFLMGPEGTRRIKTVPTDSTLRGILTTFQTTGAVELKSHPINRKIAGDSSTAEAGDTGVVYQAIISDGQSIYGDREGLSEPVVPALTRDMFRLAIKALFEKLRSEDSGSDRFDYILVDTRGGFAFESTDVCALADSFIVVTEPDFTSFYQDRNLVDRISTAGQEVQQKSLLRAVIVNKATEGKEENFRLALQKEFGIRFEDTHALPLDVDTIQGYRTQQIPYMVAPGSGFANATLAAFADIFNFVTGAWPEDRIDRWNALVQLVSTAAATRKRKLEQEDEARSIKERALQELTQERERLTERVASLQRELEVTRVHLRQIEEYGVKGRSTEMGKEAPGDGGHVRNWLNPREWLSWRGLLVLYFVFAGLGSVTWFAYQQYTKASTDSRLERLYATGGPPAVRLRLLNDLYRTGQRAFDSIDLSDTNLTGVNLSEVSMIGARLSGASLSMGSLDGANLRNARLDNADLSRTSLVGTNLTGAILRGANLQDAQLKNAVFTLADLGSAELRGADLSGANLRGANLKGAYVSRAQLTSSELDPNTVLPSGARYGDPIEKPPRAPSKKEGK